MVYRIRKPGKHLKGTIHLTASKSESNRVLIIRALCDRQFSIANLADAQDTRTLEQILTNAQLPTPNSQLPTTNDVGPAGTAMRFLAAYFSILPGERILTGSERMKQRPVGILVDALRSLGASVEYTEKKGYPPLRIEGKKLAGGSLEIDGSVSSQFISALLMIAPILEKGLELRLKGELASRPYINMTLKVMERFGISYSWKDGVISIAPQRYEYNSEEAYRVEADWSAASYYYSMAALAQDADLTITGLEKQSLQGDSVVADLYTFFGVRTEFIENGIRLTKTKAPADQFVFDFSDCPDIAQTAAVTVAGLGISALLNGLHTLKIKETDRIAAVRNELENLGVRVEATDRSLLIIPGSKLRTTNSQLPTYNDHRMAMAFAPLALLLDEISIDDPGVVKKSYPGFWDDLRALGFEIEEK
jgi:3-phosphoshikimate 1-carboxyvinyltransferase